MKTTTGYIEKFTVYRAVFKGGLRDQPPPRNGDKIFSTDFECLYTQYIKNIATRNISWSLNIPKCICSQGSALDFAGGSHSPPQTP